MRPRLCFLLLIGVLALAGCGGKPQQQIRVVVIGDAVAPFAALATGHGRLPLAAQQLRAATTEGLVALDEQGRISPALADRWIVTADGESYIFRLRTGTWPDGAPLTGESLGQALRQALAGLQHTPLALDLDGIADIRAMAGQVVEIRLAHPMPDLLQLLAQPELGLVHHGRGTGPMALARNGMAALLTPISPEKRGLPAVAGWAEAEHGLVLRGARGGDAVAAFAEGRADVVLGGTFADLPRTGRLTTLSGAVPRFDAVTGLFGLVVTPGDALLAEAPQREAIAMAIDRDALATTLAAPGWIATSRVIPPGIDDDPVSSAERWVGTTLPDRRATAAARVAVWTRLHHQPAHLRIALPEGPGADVIFTRLQGDLAAISVDLLRVAPDASADLRLIDVVARYSRGMWFLDQLSCAGHITCNPAADALAQQARATSDGAAAVALTARAESILTADNRYIPLGVPVRWSLAANDRAGFAANRWGLHALMALATGDHES